MFHKKSGILWSIQYQYGLKKLFFIVFCAILIVCGLFFKQGNQNLNEYKWVTVLLDTEHSKSVLKKEGEQAISFVISVLSIIGMIFLIFYTVACS